MVPDRRVLVLANAAAGSSEQDRLDEVCQALQEGSATGAGVVTPGTDQEYAAAVASAAGRDVVVVGGDGSVHRLVQELSDQGLLDQVGVVGLVPTGTGNDLARDAGVPLDWRDAVEVALDGRAAARGILLDDDGRVVVNVVHCGVAAEATASAAEVKGAVGRTAYVWGALQAGLTRIGWHLRVEVDGVTVVDGSDRVLMVSAALGSSVGGGTLIAPDARPDDGLVDVLVATGTSPAARVGFARDLRRGRHTAREDVVTRRGREVVVEAVGVRDAFRVNADGDVSEDRTRGRRWGIVEAAWQLRVPQ